MNLRYDEENRLVEASDATHRVVYIYDGLGRRVERQEFANDTQTNLVRYVYDGWRVVEELDANFATLRSYTRGVDLSGSFEGAGGIGGLLAMAQPAGSIFTVSSYFYDGNGNGIDLVGDDGNSLAHYQYSPFGDTLVASGLLAGTNPYQFSSKERDPLTGQYYYGYRFYDPTLGRWLSRDPIEEQGSSSLYTFVSNRPTSVLDPLGDIPTEFEGSKGVTIDRPLINLPGPLPSPGPGGPGGTSNYEMNGPGQNCAGAACERREWINWPYIGFDPNWTRARSFVPSGCIRVANEGVTVATTRCECKELELIVFLYKFNRSRTRPDRFGGTMREFNDPFVDFHVVGRVIDHLPAPWTSKKGALEGIENIIDPDQNVLDAYGLPRPGVELVKLTFCCKNLKTK
jgi:RHS repeat-associated protein